MIRSYFLQPVAFSVAIYLLSWSRSVESFLLRPLHCSNRSKTRKSCGKALQLSTPSGGDNEDTSAKVRFSGLEISSNQPIVSSTTASTNLFDTVLSVISSDIGSIALGLIGLCLLLIERLSLPDATTLGTDVYQYAEKLGEETRSNLIAVLACGSVLLNGISKLDVTSALAEAVELEGVTLTEPLQFDSENNDDSFREHRDMLQWSMESLLQATPAKTVAILRTTTDNDNKWEVMSMLGTVPLEVTVQRPTLPSSMPILDRFQKDGSGRETYLPTLQALPGKTEFTYIPDNTQEVVILSVPMPTKTATTSAITTAILLGSNRAKSFTPRDVAWCQTLARQIGAVLSE